MPSPNSQKTTKSYTQKEIERNWRLIDADGKILGRLATEIANALRGKDKPEFTPNQDIGDFVVVINAEKFKVSGDKENQKLYNFFRNIAINRRLIENRDKSPKLQRWPRSRTKLPSPRSVPHILSQNLKYNP